MTFSQVSPRKAAAALGEIHGNQQSPNSRSPLKSTDASNADNRGRSRSPTKNAFPSIGFRNKASPVKEDAKPREVSPKKMKSGTNLAALLSRPKSFKNLRKQADKDATLAMDKENTAPSTDYEVPTPIWAQFASNGSRPSQDNHTRPMSFQAATPLKTPAKPDDTASSSKQHARGRSIAAAFKSGHGRSKSVAATPKPSTPLEIDAGDINKHLEALLDRRNIPENQRYKMRNLNDTIKMEFIRQDWAEMQAAKSQDSSAKDAAAVDSEVEEEQQRRGRGRSFTFSRSRKNSASPTKRDRRDASVGRHLRSKSTDNVPLDRPVSSGGASGGVSSVLSMIKPQQGPSDYVAYLRKVTKPESIEVGKIHKLRLLLRNETVAWIEAFIEQGGMEEMVNQLNRIMDVEWRADHEDALLHENLLCLKALATTARAMEYLKAQHTQLFPKLLHLIFDPEKKGPSEFTTRNIITSILTMYISSASPAERIIRAKQVLKHLRDPEPKEADQPLPWVLEMRQERPYRVWSKEAVSVTKEVFWIFLHNMNVVSLPPGITTRQEDPFAASNNEPYAYMNRHFPHERPPVPAAPYVGGVEWDATNYLASHLDLMNALIACTATQEARNEIRGLLRISGWERCMGGSLRMCKEKFYGCVHEALRTWVAAAAEDGWKVDDVRFGPVAADISRGHSPIKRKDVEDAPKLEMPRFDLGSDDKQQTDAWL